MDALARVRERFRTAKASGRAMRISFDDQIWLPVVENLPVAPYDFVLVDETQDVNRCQLELVKMAAGDHGRVVAVGDPQQAIYDFRGANCAAMDKLINELKAKVLTLSVCYRCPSRVVRIAKQLVPDIEPAPEAKSGTVQNIHEEELLHALVPGDVVLSRTNAANAMLCLRLARIGKRALVKGKVVSDNLRRIIKDFGDQDGTRDLSVFLQLKLTQIREAHAEGKMGEVQAVLAADSIHILKLFQDEAKSQSPRLAGAELVRNITGKITQFFEGENKYSTDDKIMLSSVHQAKGLEFPKVYLLLPTFSLTGGKEELNLLYVAITRAQHDLIVVGYDAEILCSHANGKRHVMFNHHDASLRRSGEPLGQAWPFGNQVRNRVQVGFMNAMFALF
jgi:DNA helicase-2/ATP-dependent DNA helicase PcrA